MQRHAQTRRRGSAYVMVLGGALIVSMLGMSALYAMRIARRGAEGALAAAQARLHARSAIELGLLTITQNDDWRTDYTCGAWATNAPIGAGKYTLIVTESDADLNETDVCAAPQTNGDAFSGQPCRSVVLTACGYQGRARQVLQVTLQPGAANVDPLADAITTLGPVAWWRLGEDSNSSPAADAMNLQNGTYRNDPQTGRRVPFRCDTAVRLDGTNDLVEIPHHNAFLINNGSILLWFSPTGSMSGLRGLFSKAWFGNAKGGDVSIWIQDGEIYAGLEDTSTAYFVNGGALSANDWYQVVFTFGSSGMHLYINDEEVDSDPYTGGLGTSAGGMGNSEPIALGVTLGSSEPFSIEGWTNPFRGHIDEVAIFSRVLSADDVAALYTLGSLTAPTSMRPEPGTWRPVVDD